MEEHTQNFYTQEDLVRAREVSLTALAASLGYTPYKVGSVHKLKEFHSLVIFSDQSFYRYSVQHGGSQIDFLLLYGNMCLTKKEAILYLAGKGIKENIAGKIMAEEMRSKKDMVKKEFVLPKPAANYCRLYAYLHQKRKLSYQVIDFFVKEKLIYEECVHHNIVFCGRDKENRIRYAGLHGTYDQGKGAFKGDVEGNDKRYGLNIVNMASKKLYVFEAFIDCMSYIDLYNDYESNKVVLSMLSEGPLDTFLCEHPGLIEEIWFCLDNDIRGVSTTVKLLRKYIRSGFCCKSLNAETGKDFNDMLRQKRGEKSEF